MEADASRGPAASSKCPGGGHQRSATDQCVLQRGGGGAEGSAVDMVTRVMKVESGAGLTDFQGAELHFLRSRVRQLERERAEMASENLRLKNMLVNEIPGLLSTMWQTLGQSSQSVSPPGDHNGFSPSSYTHHHHHDDPANNNNLPATGLFSGQHHAVSIATSEDHLRLHPVVMPTSEDMGGDMSPYGEEDEEEEEEEKVRAGEMGVAQEAPPMCTQTDMTLASRRCCSDAPPCSNGDVGTHVGIPISANQEREPLALYHKVNHVEIYPGSGVSCDVRSWHAANQAQSPTAMARTLLLGVFDMTTLMSSNLRGGRSRRSSFHEQRSALDPQRINAIFNATLSRFPLARKGVIGTGINSKLSEIRFRSRRANREPPYL